MTALGAEGGAAGTEQSEAAPAAPRRVVIDALAARYGGAAHATVNLVGRLADDPAIEEVVLVARSGSIVATGVRPHAGVRLLTLRPARRLELLHRLGWEAFALPRVVADSTPGAVITWSGMLPRRLPAPVVCYLANPLVYVRRGPANAVRRWALRRTVRGAEHVLVPTEGMADLIADNVGRRPEVVALGVDHAAFGPAPQPGGEVLCVADFYRHKRHDLLLAAWAALPRPRPRLRLIGDDRVDPAGAAALRREIERFRRHGEVVVQSALPLQELVDAYRRARVFVTPSEAESFCLPLLEAQACGVPAIARDLPSLRETGGVATTFVSGDVPGDWTAALARLLRDEAVHAAARAAGLEHAGHYGWDRTAAALRDRVVR